MQEKNERKIHAPIESSILLELEFDFLPALCFATDLSLLHRAFRLEKIGDTLLLDQPRKRNLTTGRDSPVQTSSNGKSKKQSKDVPLGDDIIPRMSEFTRPYELAEVELKNWLDKISRDPAISKSLTGKLLVEKCYRWRSSPEHRDEKALAMALIFELGNFFITQHLVDQADSFEALPARGKTNPWLKSKLKNRGFPDSERLVGIVAEELKELNYWSEKYRKLLAKKRILVFSGDRFDKISLAGKPAMTYQAWFLLRIYKLLTKFLGSSKGVSDLLVPLFLEVAGYSPKERESSDKKRKRNRPRETLLDWFTRLRSSHTEKAFRRDYPKIPPDKGSLKKFG